MLRYSIVSFDYQRVLVRYCIPGFRYITVHYSSLLYIPRCSFLCITKALLLDTRIPCVQCITRRYFGDLVLLTCYHNVALPAHYYLVSLHYQHVVVRHRNPCFRHYCDITHRYLRYGVTDLLPRCYHHVAFPERYPPLPFRFSALPRFGNTPRVSRGCNGQAAKSLSATASYRNHSGQVVGWLHDMWGLKAEWVTQQGALWRQWNEVLLTGRTLEPSASQVQSFGPMCRKLFR